VILPRWLSVIEILRLHEIQIRTYGGQPGIRDEGLLESAVMRPRLKHHYDRPRTSSIWQFRMPSQSAVIIRFWMGTSGLRFMQWPFSSSYTDCRCTRLLMRPRRPCSHSRQALCRKRSCRTGSCDGCDHGWTMIANRGRRKRSSAAFNANHTPAVYVTGLLRSIREAPRPSPMQ
jgi:hypothetical protein